MREMPVKIGRTVAAVIEPKSPVKMSPHFARMQY
jgi:hypothetical protein